MVKFGDFVWRRTHHDVDISKTSSGESLDVNVSTIEFFVLNIPVLSSNKISVNTEPVGVLVLAHIERMVAIRVS